MTIRTIIKHDDPSVTRALVVHLNNDRVPNDEAAAPIATVRVEPGQQAEFNLYNGVSLAVFEEGLSHEMALALHGEVVDQPMTVADDTVEIVAILDRSGSMARLASDSVVGFNNFLAGQKAVPGSASLTLVMFNHERTVLFTNKLLGDVSPLTQTDYITDGYTALNDAIVSTMNELFARAPKRAIICIMTDGLENASRQHTNAEVGGVIASAEARGWKVTYLAANQDAFAVGGAMGVRAVNTANFAATASGVRSAYRGASMASAEYRTGVGSTTLSDAVAGDTNVGS